MDKSLKNDIIQWDIKSWSKSLRYWENAVDWNKIENVLELGSREGGLSLWLALKGKNIVCSDINNSSIKAQPLHTKYGVSEKITYEDIDATTIPYKNHFDLIIFKSMVTVIGRNGNMRKQQQVFDQVYKALKPGGIVLFAENLKASALHQWSRKKFVKWGKSCRYLSVADIRIFLEKFSLSEIKTTGILGTFGRTESQRSILAGLDSLVLNRICPSKWNYVVYGKAVK
jgi:SAM-dependent methyltransferase